MDLNLELGTNDSDEDLEDSESEMVAAMDAGSGKKVRVDDAAMSDDEMWETDNELDNDEYDAELAEEDDGAKKWDSMDSENPEDDDAELDEEAEGEVDDICNDDDNEVGLEPDFGYARF